MSDEIKSDKYIYELAYLPPYTNRPSVRRMDSVGSQWMDFKDGEITWGESPSFFIAPLILKALWTDSMKRGGRDFIKSIEFFRGMPSHKKDPKNQAVSAHVER